MTWLGGRACMLQADFESRALSRPALDTDRAAHRFNKLFRDGKPEARPLRFRRVSDEWLKKIVHELRVDPRAGIGYRDEYGLGARRVSFFIGTGPPLNAFRSTNASI